jgi:hypothetical protein
VAIGLVLFTAAFTPFAKADEWDRKTVITTNGVIQIEGEALEPGRYVMKLLDSGSDRTVVQIYSRYQTKLVSCPRDK